MIQILRAECYICIRCLMETNISRCIYCLEPIFLPESIYPCNCTQPKHIHCFKKWMRNCPLSTRTRCEICKSHYKYILDDSPTNQSRDTFNIIMYNYNQLGPITKQCLTLLVGWIPITVYVLLIVYGNQLTRQLVIAYVILSVLLYMMVVSLFLYFKNSRYRTQVLPLRIGI
jgi:hypothetical protein